MLSETQFAASAVRIIILMLFNEPVSGVGPTMAVQWVIVRRFAVPTMRDSERFVSTQT